jgi:hypothetical protein
MAPVTRNTAPLHQSVASKPKDKTPMTLLEFIEKLDTKLPPFERSQAEIEKLDKSLIDFTVRTPKKDSHRIR